MRNRDTVSALKRLKVETGSIVCLGCGYEHNCSTKGCRILREAADTIEELSRENESLADTVNKADEIIRSRGGKWISAKEQLPERTNPLHARDVFLVRLRSGCIKTLLYEYDNSNRCRPGMSPLFKEGWAETDTPVTHWMPLPEQPKEDNK